MALRKGIAESRKLHARVVVRLHGPGAQVEGSLRDVQTISCRCEDGILVLRCNDSLLETVDALRAAFERQASRA